ncbi:hypothetical protein [Paenibacillus macerans]|uniref:hypothetical protein n=1 Tax=Paenibacillus macerans TaxID=44252 RepID=UPI003D313E80
MNTMVTKLFSGDISVLPEYISYIESNKDESLLSLLNIMEAANRHNFNVDEILQRFDISSVTMQDDSKSVYTRQTIEERLARFYYELADYYLNKGQYKEGFIYLMTSLDKSVRINKKSFVAILSGLKSESKESSQYCSVIRE